jgi:hypothetical protein
VRGAQGFPVSDAVSQGALKLILEPIFEADFQPGSFGYRPKKTAHEAAMGRLNVPSARDALLSFIDPEAPWIDVNINFGLRNTQLFAGYVSKWASQDPTLKQRLISLSEATLTQTQSQLLSAIYRELGDERLISGGVFCISRSQTKSPALSPAPGQCKRTPWEVLPWT